MKIMKRISAMLLAICLVIPCFSMVVQAADVIYFTDLETTVGATLEVTGTVHADNENIGDVSIHLSYDASYLRFVSGDGVTEASAGTLVYTGTGNSDTLEFKVQFQALQEGSSRIEQGDTTVYTQSGATLKCTPGYSDITIGAGDPSLITNTTNTGSGTVTIDGVDYTISDSFSENSLPEGFSAAEYTYNEGTFKGAASAGGDVKLAYLIDANQKGEFWVYNEKDGTFDPFEEIIISDTYSIVILNGTKEITMPSKYTEVSLTVNEKEFPVWSEPNREGYYVLYAVNSDGDKSLYLFDSVEHTYQRMETPAQETTPEGQAKGLWEKVTAFITSYMIWAVVGVACILVILFVFLLVLAIKLHHRNVELDDLYDEYGIDTEPGASSNAKPAVKGKKRKSSKYDDYEDDDDFFDDEEDDLYDDDEYESDDEYYDDDEYDDEEEDDLASLREDFARTKQADSKRRQNYDEYYDDEEFDDEPAGQTKDFTMDFIDLD